MSDQPYHKITAEETELPPPPLPLAPEPTAPTAQVIIVESMPAPIAAHITTATTTTTSTWRTALCCPHLESCFVSFVVPCHTIAKISNSVHNNYNTIFITYALFWACNNYAHYVQYYINKNTCPDTSTTWCVDYKEDTCEDYYTTIDSVNVPCLWNEDYGVCLSSSIECKSSRHFETFRAYMYVLETLTFFGLFASHFIVRSHLRKKKKYKPSCLTDIIATTCCNTCGLAQEYRELI